MVEPDIYAFLDWIIGVAAGFGLVILPEVHDRYATHERLAAHGYWTYDFVLPGLLLHAFETGSAARLCDHLARSPERQFTMLDCHDGIPVRPDLDGILEPDEMLGLADLVQRRGGNVNRILSDAHADNSVDVHQLNCTYYSALDADDDRYVAGSGDPALRPRRSPDLLRGATCRPQRRRRRCERRGPRDQSPQLLDGPRSSAEIGRPVVRRVMELIRLRNSASCVRRVPRRCRRRRNVDPDELASRRRPLRARGRPLLRGDDGHGSTRTRGSVERRLVGRAARQWFRSGCPPGAGYRWTVEPRLIRALVRSCWLP